MSEKGKFEEILAMCFGTLHPKTARLIPKAKKVIETLNEHGNEMNRDELASELGYDLSNSADKKRFYNVVSPLMNKLIMSSRAQDGSARYRLSYDAFRVWLEGMRKTVHYQLEERKQSEI